MPRDLPGKKMPISRYFVLTVLFLLLGAALRLSGVGYLADVIDFDEAYYGMDAATLLDDFRFEPFFDGNNGRESLWMYTLLPAISVMDGQPLALRLTAVMVGILTLAAVYQLARELFDSRTAAWSTGVLAVVYWHVHLSHIGFRVILFPLVGTLALALLLRAYRLNKLHHWLTAGLVTGLVAYTYLAARVWIGVIGILMAGMFLRADTWLQSVGQTKANLPGAAAGCIAMRPYSETKREGRRWGVLLAGGIAAVMAVPLVQYLATHPQVAGVRLEDVGVSSLQLILENSIRWFMSIAWIGSTYYFHNFAGRPILDIPLLILCAAGTIYLLRRFPRRAIFLIVLAGVSVAPSIFSKEAPHYLRAIGMVIPLAIAGGAGAAWLEKRLSGVIQPRWAMAAVLALVLLSAGRTWTDFWNWSHDFRFPDWRQDEQTITWALVDYLQNPGDNIQPEYFSHGDRNPYLGYMLHPFALKRLDIFEFPGCAISPLLPFVYVGRQVQEPDLTAHVSEVTLVQKIYGIGTRYDYAIYEVAEPDAIFSDEVGSLMSVALTEPLPDALSPGDMLDLELRLRPLASTTRPYTLFVHVYPADRLELMAQVDAPICPEYPPPRWYPDYEARVRHSLPLPADLPPGEYRVAVGIYDNETGERLPVEHEPGGFLVVGTLVVKE